LLLDKDDRCDEEIVWFSISIFRSTLDLVLDAPARTFLTALAADEEETPLWCRALLSLLLLDASIEEVWEVTEADRGLEIAVVEEVRRAAVEGALCFSNGSW
jgi:hypothetical protein